MRPTAPPELLAEIERWAALSQWERAEIGRALRRLAWTYGEIRSVIDVPKGTLAGWCREMRLTDEQIGTLKERTRSPRGVPRDTQRKRREEVERIRADARGFALTHLHDPLFVAGTVLYWGEGAKTSPRLALSNTDADALRLFTRWVRRFHEPDAAFVLALHLHEGNDDDAARRWWAAALGLHDPEFTKTFVKPSGTGHRKNRLHHGVCRVVMRRSADAWHATMGWDHRCRRAVVMQMAPGRSARLPSGR